MLKTTGGINFIDITGVTERSHKNSQKYYRISLVCNVCRDKSVYKQKENQWLLGDEGITKQLIIRTWFPVESKNALRLGCHDGYKTL